MADLESRWAAARAKAQEYSRQVDAQRRADYERDARESACPECEALRQEAASLRQRLEEMTHERDVLSAAVTAGVPAFLEDCRVQATRAEAAEARASQAEATLEEMQKQIDDWIGWTRTICQTQQQGEDYEWLIAELQRRRSALGQEKA